MSWFHRKNAADGDDLYRGDAPVLMPGQDGAAPSAYISGAQQGAAAPPDPSWSAPPAAGWSSNPEGVPPLDWAPPAAPPGEWSPPPGWSPSAPPADWQSPLDGNPPPVTAGGFYPAQQRGRPGSAERTARRVGLGCFSVVAIFVLLIVVGVVVAVLATVRSAAPDFRGTAPATVVGTVDVPSTVRYDDADLQITIGGAQSQPGAGWRSSAAAPPNLVIRASIQSASASTGRTTIPFVYWSFAPDDGSPPLTLNIVSGFEPAIVTSSLAPGEQLSGYLAFETTSTAGTLSLTGGYGDPPLASWRLTATPAAPVTGAPAVPAQAQVGKPPFTVTLAATTWVDAAGDIVRQPPTTGSYLIADLTIIGTGESSSGIIDQGLFVFVPAGGQPVASVDSGAVSGTTSITSVAGGSNTEFRLAFDVPVGAGTLELRDYGGRTMIQWPVG